MKIQSTFKKKMSELNLTQDALAASIGVTKGAVNQFINGGGMRLDKFIQACKVIGIDLEGFIESGGSWIPVEETDARGMAWQFIENEADDDQLKRLIEAALTRIAWDVLPSEQARAKALLPDVRCSNALRELAEDDNLWNATQPTGIEIDHLENRIARRSGAYKDKWDWLNMLRKEREKGNV